MTAAKEQTVDELMASLEGRIARLQKYLPPEPKQEKRKPIVELPFLSKCPLCHGEMEVCKVRIGNGAKSPVWPWPHGVGFVTWVGLTILCLVFWEICFLPRAKPPESGVLENPDIRRSCRCKSCGFVGLEQAKMRRC
jgi:hypothetical protein